MTSSTKLLSGYCPDRECQSKIVFPSCELNVECSRCGEHFRISEIRDVTEEKDQTTTLQTVLRTLLAAGNSNKKGMEMIKVSGLSNYHCKLLSPLLTHHGMDKKTGKAKLLSEITTRETFDCSVLGDRAFRIDQQHIDMPGYGQDLSGSAIYLAGTLSRIRATNGNRDLLIPIHADGDGHCLVHAVSRALVGRELFWHPLRTNLKDHIIHNIDQYKKLFIDFFNAAEWMDIIQECDPEYEPMDESEILGLRNIHVFGLANVLRRPIILLDSVAGMKSSGDYSAVFLPALESPERCRGKSERLNKPLCLAWSSSAHNHYIPLVGIKGADLPRLSRNLLPKVWAMPQALLDKYIEFDEYDRLIIGGDKPLQDSYIKKLTTAMDDLYLQKYGVHPALVVGVNQYCYHKTGPLNLKPAQVLTVTLNVVNERRLYRCLACDTYHVMPFAKEWLCPGTKGIIYNFALRKYGPLREDKIYSFYNYGLECSYDATRDMLVIDNQDANRCPWCRELSKMRLLRVDGSVEYENGDATRSRSQSQGGTCKCGYKHWWNGTEYDNMPEIVRVLLTWGNTVAAEEVPWFQYESDRRLNSNAYEIATNLVNKHFPGEFGSEILIQKVVDQILELTKKPESEDVPDNVTCFKPLPLHSKEPKGSNLMVGEDKLKSPVLSDVPVPVPVSRNKDQSKKLAVSSSKVRRIASDNPTYPGELQEDERNQLQKTQHELENQQRDYILRRERDYRQQQLRCMQLSGRYARTPEDPGGSSEAVQLGGRAYAFTRTTGKGSVLGRPRKNVHQSFEQAAAGSLPTAQALDKLLGTVKDGAASASASASVTSNSLVLPSTSQDGANSASASASTSVTSNSLVLPSTSQDPVDRCLSLSPCSDSSSSDARSADETVTMAMVHKATAEVDLPSGDMCSGSEVEKRKQITE